MQKIPAMQRPKSAYHTCIYQSEIIISYHAHCTRITYNANIPYTYNIHTHTTIYTTILIYI